MAKLRGSPNIIELEAIVVNQEHCIRGFLMPFMHNGNLEDIFDRVREGLGGSEGVDELVLDWPLKLNWAREITRGVADLHAIAAYNGDLKPQNVVIGPTGQAILIDFLSDGISEEFAAPEVLAKYWEPGTSPEAALTGPADVYSLGLLLYALAEEKSHVVYGPSWRDGSVPSWYRDVVQRCLYLDSAARPSALDVLSILQKEAN